MMRFWKLTDIWLTRLSETTRWRFPTSKASTWIVNSSTKASWRWTFSTRMLGEVQPPYTATIWIMHKRIKQLNNCSWYFWSETKAKIEVKFQTSVTSINSASQIRSRLWAISPWSVTGNEWRQKSKALSTRYRIWQQISYSRSSANSLSTKKWPTWVRTNRQKL